VTYLGQRLQKRHHLVSTATNGPDGIELAKKQVFDVALVDLKMPEMDGIAVMAELHAIQPYLEAIMLTGHGSHNSALQAGKLNAYRYLIKPYDFDKLLETIRAAYGERRDRLRRDYQRRAAGSTAARLSAEIRHPDQGQRFTPRDHRPGREAPARL